MIKKVDFDELIAFDVKKSNNSFVNYIAYQKDQILGYIEYNDLYESIDIVNIFVLEEYRNVGIGYKLLKELINIAKKGNKENITLEVSSLNDVAINLYKKVGFKQVAIRKGYYKGIDGYLMELIL